jgi:hypothetical protein
MPIAPIIPDCKIILPPLEAHLRIVILCYEIEQIWQKHVRLIPRDTVDTLREAFIYEDGLPSSNRCGTYQLGWIERRWELDLRLVRMIGWTASRAAP